MKNLLYALLLIGSSAFSQSPIRTHAAGVAIRTSPGGRPIRTVNIAYNLPVKAMTSAGIYSSAGKLIRTLWTLQEKEAGPNEYAWDGTLDNGSAAPADSYELRIVYSNVKYSWQWPVGNTSDSLTGITKYRQYDMLHDLCLSGDTLFTAFGWSEGATGKNWSYKNFPNTRYELLPLSGSTGPHSQLTYFICTDGKAVYYAGNDLEEFKDSGFVFAVNNSDLQQKSFAFGRSVEMKPKGRGFIHTSAICYQYGPISGMDVCRNARYLFVTRYDNDTLFVYDKTTGEPLARINVPGSPRNVKVGLDDASVWLITGASTVRRYTLLNDYTLQVASAPLPGLVAATALAVDPTGNISVVDSTREQLVTYDRDGNWLWDLGELGGYTNETLVTDTRFFFNVGKLYGQRPLANFIRYEPDGSFWLGDPGNVRVLHFKSDRTLLHKVQYVTANYNVFVDAADSSRLFSQHVEYKIDYTKTPSNQDGGYWKLHRNYGHSDRYVKEKYSVCTFPNARTYALMVAGSSGQKELAEFTNAGIRFSGRIVSENPALFNKHVPCYLYPDGSLRGVWNAGGDPPGTAVYWWKRALVGYDEDGYPKWGNYDTLATIDQQSGELSPTGRGLINPVSISTSGIIPVLQQYPQDVSAYHVGGIKVGGTSYTWKSAKGTGRPYSGVFPTPDYFDDGNEVRADAAGKIEAFGKNVFWTYNGEFWKGNQTAKFAHLHENGLAVGQFGVTGDILPKGAAGMSGNTYTFSVAKVSNDVYHFFVNDEQHHGAVPVWAITGLSTIKELRIPFVVPFRSERAALNYAPVFAALPNKGELVGAVGNTSKYPAASSFPNGRYYSAYTGNQSFNRQIQTDLMLYHERPGAVRDSFVVEFNKDQLSRWKLSADVAFFGLRTGNQDTAMIALLDQAGQRLASVEWRTDPADHNYTMLYINGNQVFRVSSDLYRSYAEAYTPVTLTASLTGLTVKYGQFGPYSITTGDRQKPGKIVVYFVSPGNEVRWRHIGIMNPKLYTR